MDVEFIASVLSLAQRMAKELNPTGDVVQIGRSVVEPLSIVVQGLAEKSEVPASHLIAAAKVIQSTDARRVAELLAEGSVAAAADAVTKEFPRGPEVSDRDLSLAVAVGVSLADALARVLAGSPVVSKGGLTDHILFGVSEVLVGTEPNLAMTAAQGINLASSRDKALYRLAIRLEDSNADLALAAANAIAESRIRNVALTTLVKAGKEGPP